MDRYVKHFSGVQDCDLVLTKEGVAYQYDMSAGRVPYDAAYFNLCLSYEDQEIALRINAHRMKLVEQGLRLFPFKTDELVLDIGIGSGEFIKKRGNTFGYDINEKAVRWLKTRNLYSDRFEAFRAYTMWDVLEHLENPAVYLDRMGVGSLLFISIPIFDDLEEIRASRHYRPGEHLYYFTEKGLLVTMALHGFEMMGRDNGETEAGRDSIMSYIFRRYLPASVLAGAFTC